MHSSSTFLLVVVVTLICANLPSRVEPKKTMKSLPTARHGSINNTTLSVMNGTFNTSNVIHGRSNNITARKKRAKSINKIPGGQIAQKGHFPFMVSIYNARIHKCAGTLIQADWVLTGLHCIRGLDFKEPKFDPSVLTVFAGHTDLNQVKFDDIKPGDPDMRKVHETYPHENFVSLSNGGDIGLMRLVSSFNLGENIQLAPMDPDNRTKDYYEEKWIGCTTTGWGLIEERESSRNRTPPPDITRKKREKSFPRPLRYLEVDTMSTDSCDSQYQNMTSLPISNKFHICAQGRFKRMCHGDSGGPLLCGFYQVGVASFQLDCARNPTVYTRIAAYQTWIKDTMDLHKDDVILKDSSVSLTRIRSGACVVGVAIIVMVINFNVLC